MAIKALDSRVVADRLVAGPVAARGTEIIHQMDDEMRATALLGEAVVLRVKLMAIKSQTQFHVRRWFDDGMRLARTACFTDETYSGSRLGVTSRSLNGSFFDY